MLILPRQGSPFCGCVQSVTNLVVNVLTKLSAYTAEEKKPSHNFTMEAPAVVSAIVVAV